MVRPLVAVVTTTRADAGPLRPVLASLSRSDEYDVVVFGTGTHLAAGVPQPSLEQFVGESDTLVDLFDMEVSDDTPHALACSGGRLLRGVSEFLARRVPDVVVLLGDRWELLPVATACLLHQVPIAHLHGGEVSEGAIDDRIRHALTKLSDLHLVAHEEAAQRIYQLGEETQRVIVAGAPALDDLISHTPITLEDLSDRLKLPLIRPIGLVTYHPATVDRSRLHQRVESVLSACTARLRTVIVTAPGLEPGRDEVLKVIHDWAGTHLGTYYRPHLGPLYRDALCHADVMVGNSSSGIIEAASVELPVVDVGSRQAGRLRAGNVVHVDDDQGAYPVAQAIDHALSPVFRSSLRGISNPYGRGDAAYRITAALAAIRDLPRTKQFSAIDASGEGSVRSE